MSARIKPHCPSGKGAQEQLVEKKNQVQFDFLVPGAKVWIKREKADGNFLLESSNLQECP